MTAEGFNPHILGFFCHWCCYAAADAAGVSRYQYPPNVRVIRVMCTGRIDVRFILEAFRCGADGVFTGGWHLGECHYQSGNYEAMIIAETCRQVLRDVGVNPDRMALEWASAAEAPRFVELITGYVSDIKSMGPLGTVDGESEEDVISMHLKAGVKAASARKVRTSLGKLAKDMNKSNDYSPQVISAGVANKVLPAFRKERLTQEIQLCLTEQGPCISADLCKKTGGSKDEIDKILETLSKKELVKKKGSKWYEIGN